MSHFGSPFWFHFVTFWVSFSYFFRIWASLRWWQEARVWTKCKKEEKQSKKESPNETLLIRNLCFLQLLFYWFLEQSWEVFLTPWWPKCPKWGLLGDTFPAMLQQHWKAENYGFVYTKHYFSEFWGAGLRHFAQFFSRFFLRRVWRRDFTIFWEFEGPAVAPKTTFGEHFRYTFYVVFL